MTNQTVILYFVISCSNNPIRDDYFFYLMRSPILACCIVVITALQQGETEKLFTCHSSFLVHERLRCLRQRSSRHCESRPTSSQHLPQLLISSSSLSKHLQQEGGENEDIDASLSVSGTCISSYALAFTKRPCRGSTTQHPLIKCQSHLCDTLGTATFHKT